jgi:hypothetical protein
MEDHIISHEFQVNMPNGDIDFITVYDLPYKHAEKFVSDKYLTQFL